MSRKWVIQQIVAMETDGTDLSENAVRSSKPELHETACNLFSSWATALEYAGVSRQHEEARHRVRREIRKLCRDNYVMAEGSIGRKLPKLMATALRLHGSWEQAVREAGINYERVCLGSEDQMGWSRQEVLAAIQDRHRSGQSMELATVVFEDQLLVSRAKNRYRSWGAALEAAGVAD